VNGNAVVLYFTCSALRDSLVQVSWRFSPCGRPQLSSRPCG